MFDIKFSVIVPVYNSEKYLGKCIDSILAQSYSNWELILVDDGSEDSSKQICEYYSHDNKSIKFVSKSNGGPSSARNAGLEKAVGNYILFLDSDDALSDRCLEVINVHLLDKNPDCLIFGIQQATGLVWAPTEQKLYTSKREIKDSFYTLYNKELLSPVVNKVFKKELIKDKFPKGVDYGEDLMFSLNYLQYCQSVQLITDKLYLHDNANEHSLTHSVKLGRLPQIEQIEDRALAFGGAVDNYVEYLKYAKDVGNYLMRLLSSEQIAKKYIKHDVCNWLSTSRFKTLDLNLFPFSRRQQLILELVKRGRISFALMIYEVNKKIKRLV